MPTHPLEPLLHPRSIAVVGASGSSRGGGFVSPLVELGFEGPIYPVNPKYDEIMGMKAYPSVIDVPGDIDLAVITVKAGMVPHSLGECVQKGIRGAVIITADFAETGDRGQALQKEITEIAGKGNLRFVGPNCFGVWNAAANLNTLPVVPLKGEMGFISQSGSLTHMIARVARDKGLGMSKMVYWIWRLFSPDSRFLQATGSGFRVRGDSV